MTSSRRRARLNSKQKPMTPSSNPSREASDQEGCPDPTVIPEQTELRPEEYDELQEKDRPAGQIPIDDEVAAMVAELEGLSLEDSFTRTKSDIFEAASDDGEHEEEKDAGPQSPVSASEDPDGGSQTSGEESWTCFPSSSSASTDSGSDAEEEAAPPSPEAEFKFREEFEGEGDGDSDGESDRKSDSESEGHSDGDDGADSGAESPIEVEFTMEEDDEDDAPGTANTGPWSSKAVPKWAYLESSTSLPLLNLGPEDFHHGGSTLRNEVSPEDVVDQPDVQSDVQSDVEDQSVDDQSEAEDQSDVEGQSDGEEQSEVEQSEDEKQSEDEQDEDEQDEDEKQDEQEKEDEMGEQDKVNEQGDVADEDDESSESSGSSQEIATAGMVHF